MGNPKGDRVSADIGDEARSIAAGKGITQANADVHIALERIANVSERETGLIEDLSRHISALAGEVGELRQALVGNELRQQTGLIQRVKEMGVNDRLRARMHIVNSIILAIVAGTQIWQWVVIYQLWGLICANSGVC